MAVQARQPNVAGRLYGLQELWVSGWTTLNRALLSTRAAKKGMAAKSQIAICAVRIKQQGRAD
ncbi:hypothetical protein CCL07_06990 [Pseudomonas congelans]|jgi:hypothetical protein|nr:hypothetical protein CCL07_06990 [Pseudomonas congelans]